MEEKFSDFEKRVIQGLEASGVQLDSARGGGGARALGAAVSGGADSISLLYSLAKIARAHKVPLKVITVNHFIRPDKETCGDAQFVVAQCQDLRAAGYDLECDLVELARGAVDQVARERGGGTEEAARFLRYQAFAAFIQKHKLQALCLAHNKNDQLETLLMRFLQGSWTESAAGIQRRREVSADGTISSAYVRPLLDIDRQDIEAYLTSRNLTWRTDATNSDTAYLRNRIRNVLAPVLNQNFPGWQTALLTGAEKAEQDSLVIQRAVAAIPIDTSCQAQGQVSIDRSLFDTAPQAVQIRLLVKMCNLLGQQSRLPYQFFKDVLLSLSEWDNQPVKKYFANLEISLKKDKVFVKKCNKIHTDLVFFDIIEESGKYDFPFGTMEVSADIIINGLATGIKPKFPFCVRNIMPGDEVLCADGKMKSVTDVYASWKVSAEERPLIPIIADLQNGEIIALCAAFLGYKDWIVK